MKMSIEQVNYTKGEVKPQLAAQIFIESMTALKNVLCQAEDRYDGDTKSKGYVWYRAFIMDQIYPMLERQLSLMEKNGLISKCGCGADISKNRNGYRPCLKCSGSGYTNSSKYNDFLYESESKIPR